jgi:hypothetical protein
MDLVFLIEPFSGRMAFKPGEKHPRTGETALSLQGKTIYVFETMDDIREMLAKSNLPL